MELLEPVFRNVLTKRSSRAAKTEAFTTTERALVAVDGVELESTRAYSAKMGRWARETMVCISDPLWYVLTAAFRKAHSPLIHFHRFMHKKVDDEFADGTRLAQLITGKIDQFVDEFDKLLKDHSIWDPLFDKCPVVHQDWFPDLCYQITLNNFCSFFRRIVSKTTSFPLKLVCLAHNLAGTVCEQRRSVAQNLLDTPNSELDITSRKVKLGYLDVLEDIVKNGIMTATPLAKKLWVRWRLIRAMMRGETVEIEGVMNLISSIVKRAPAIRLELLSSRVGLRKQIGQGHAGASAKWSCVKTDASALLRRCVESLPEVPDVLATHARWTPPTRAIPIQDYKEKVKYLQSINKERAKQWAQWICFTKRMFPDSLEQSAHKSAVMVCFGDQRDCLSDDDHEVYIWGGKKHHVMLKAMYSQSKGVNLCHLKEAVDVRKQKFKDVSNVIGAWKYGPVGLGFETHGQPVRVDQVIEENNKKTQTAKDTKEKELSNNYLDLEKELETIMEEADIAEDDYPEFFEANASEEENIRETELKRTIMVLKKMNSEQMNEIASALDIGTSAHELTEDDLVEIALNTDIGGGNITIPDAGEKQNQKCITKWLEEARQTLAALDFRRCNDFGPSAGEPYAVGHLGQLSMILKDETVRFIHWTGKHTGRLVRVDDHHRVIAIVPQQNPLIDAQGCHILHPAIGIAPKRAKTYGRPEVPKEILRLQHMWSAVVDKYGSASVLGCTICGDACGLEEYGVENEDLVVHECALCLLPWHWHCSDKVASMHSQKSARMGRPKLSDLFKSFLDLEVRKLCGLCTEWIG